MDTSVLVPAALTFVTELDRAYPHRGKASDGSIASSAHSAANPTSDHEHGTPAPGDRDVDAVDIDADLLPAGGRQASRRAMYDDVIPRFEAHPGSQYWIHDDMICHRSEGWRARSYAYAGPGRNRHTEHAHFNWQESAAAHNDTSPYGFRGGDDMPEPADLLAYDPGTDDKGKVKRGGIPNPRKAEQAKNPTIAPSTALYRAAAVYDMLPAITERLKNVEQLAARPVTMTAADREAIVAAILAALPEYGPRKNTP